MTENKLHVNDTGTKLIFDIDPDGTNNITADTIQSATLHITKPSGLVVTRNAGIEGHTIVYYTTSDDFDEAGLYIFQPEVTLTSGWSGKADQILELVYY